MSPRQLRAARAAARAAIAAEGLVALAARIGIQPRTLSAFAHGASQPHAGTTAIIVATLEKKGTAHP